MIAKTYQRIVLSDTPPNNSHAIWIDSNTNEMKRKVGDEWIAVGQSARKSSFNKSFSKAFGNTSKQIAQQDYIYLDSPINIESGMEEDLPSEFIRTIYRCVKNGSILDCVLRRIVESGQDTYRIIGESHSADFSNITIFFFNSADFAVGSWNFDHEPDPEPTEE